MGWRRKRMKRDPARSERRESKPAAPEKRAAQREAGELAAHLSPLGHDERFDHPANAGQRAALAKAGQAALGNQAFLGVLQAKLTVNPPGDQYEQEADRVAKAIMTMPDQQLQRQAYPEEEEELLQRQVDPEEEEEELLQPRLHAAGMAGGVPAVTPALEAQIMGLQGGGQPLSAGARAFFEPRFGYDFSDVRIHAGGSAATMAQELQAQAFTTGRDIVFGPGQYRPGTMAGRHLLAHELTHVVQQADGALLRQVVQRHNVDGECETPDACALLRRGFLSVIRQIGAGLGEGIRDEAWRFAIQTGVGSFISGLNDEGAISLRIMLGEIGNMPDRVLQAEVDQQLGAGWRAIVLPMLRQRTVAFREQRAATVEEEEVEWVEEEEETAETTTAGPIRLREIESGGETFRVGDVSGRWEIIGLERDWRDVVTVRVRNRETDQEQGWSLHDWHMQLSVTHIAESTEAMGAIAEAEVQLMYELMPWWIRIPADAAWFTYVFTQNYEELAGVVTRIAAIHPMVLALERAAPISTQIFITGLAGVGTYAAGRAVPQHLNPVEWGRELGRAVRSARTLFRLIVALTQFVRGRPAAGMATGAEFFLGMPLREGATRMQDALGVSRAFLFTIGRIAHAGSGLAGAVTTISHEERMARIADWARGQGITLDNPQIEQLIREHTSETTGQQLIEVLTFFRDFLNLATRLTDQIDHQRPATPPPAAE